ncbi:MAG: PEP-CTERM sorting domain-containing protein [Phycisphaerales bacterium JB063]
MSTIQPPKTRRLLAAISAAAATIAFFPATHANAQDSSAAPILQWFESTYETQEQRLPDLFMAGYGTVWLPPPGRADSSDFSVGYDVYDRFDLGTPERPTLYGTQTGFQSFAHMVHRLGGSVHVDLILNHNGFSDAGTPGFLEGGGYPGFVLQNPDGDNDPFGTPGTDGDFNSAFDYGDLRGRLAGLIDIDHATNHTLIRHPVDPNNPLNIPAGQTPDGAGRFANQPLASNAQFYPDLDLDPIMVFDPVTGEQDIAIYPFNLDNPMAGDPVPENATGLLMRYAQWMVQVNGVDGFRIDAAKHIEGFTFDFFDRAVYRANPRTLLDGSTQHVFSYSEVFDGNRDLLQTYVVKTINDSDPGRVGGNRDALDFAQYFTLRDNLNSNAFGNDWRDVVNAGMDVYDDGLINGSSGVTFAQSHDDFGPDMGNVAHAFLLMRPGNSVVYYNALEHGEGRDFPKQGRGDALGNYGDTITTLTNIRNTHGRGDYRERWLEKENYAYERSGSALVLLSNRNDSGFDSRTLQVDHAPGTYLVELTGNAARWNNQVGNADIPEVVQVFDDFGTPKVNVRFLRNNGQDQGYLIYGLQTPQSVNGIELSNVTQVLAGGNPDPGSSYENGTTRLTDLHVITADTFDVSLATQQVNLLGSIRDQDADGDNALIRINGGIDLNHNGQVDFVTPGSVAYGFEQFTDTHDPGYFNADGNGLYAQTIDTTALPEGMNFITVRAFRHRDDGGPAVYSDFREVIYVDRLAPEAAFDTTLAFNSSGHDLDFRAVSTDGTADTMHFFLNLPADLTDAQVLALVDGSNQASQIDRDLFQRGYFDVKAGNNVLTVVTYEITGNLNVQRLAGIGIDNGNGLGAGDINFDGTLSAADLENSPGNFETFLYSQDALFNPAADVDADGRITNLDLYALRSVLQTGGADGATLAAYEGVLQRRGNINGQFGTDAFDIDALYDRLGSADWFDDLDSDGTTDQGDIDTLVRVILGSEYGDANLDGAVDEQDLAVLDANWMQSTGWAGGDFTGDAQAEWLDLALIGTHWQGDGDFLDAAQAAGVVNVGDLTGDGFVGVADLDILLANWGDSVETYNLARGDLTGDGLVGNADLQLVLNHWGEGSPPDVNIPEPGTIALLGLGLLIGSRRRR